MSVNVRTQTIINNDDIIHFISFKVNFIYFFINFGYHFQSRFEL